MKILKIVLAIEKKTCMQLYFSFSLLFLLFLYFGTVNYLSLFGIVITQYLASYPHQPKLEGVKWWGGVIKIFMVVSSKLSKILYVNKVMLES